MSLPPPPCSSGTPRRHPPSATQVGVAHLLALSSPAAAAPMAVAAAAVVAALAMVAARRGGSTRRAAVASTPHSTTLGPQAPGSASVREPPLTALQASSRPAVRAAGVGALVPLVFLANPRRPTLPTSPLRRPLRRPLGIKRDSSLP